MIGDDDIEDWDDFEEVDLSKKRYVSDDARESYIKAGKNRRQSQEETLKIYKKIHGNKYDYSKVNIITQKTQIEIICKKCNKSFFMKATSHKRRGCPVSGHDAAREQSHGPGGDGDDLHHLNKIPTS